jgi:hypothetical protein
MMIPPIAPVQMKSAVSAVAAAPAARTKSIMVGAMVTNRLVKER